MTFLSVFVHLLYFGQVRFFPVSQVAPLAQAFRALLLLVRARLPVSFETVGGLNLAAGSILLFSGSSGTRRRRHSSPTFPLFTRTSYLMTCKEM
jgi:hypothetical protein